MIQQLLFTKKWRSGRAHRSPRLNNTLNFESLEPRYLFAGAPPVNLENWQSAIFDDGVSGTLAFQFSRGTISVEPDGDTVAGNDPRFGDERLLSEIGAWSEVLTGIGNATIVGSGWDHDGQTPLAVLWDLTQRKLTFVGGNDFVVENTIVLPGNVDLFMGQVQGYRYVPQSAIVHEGLVVFILQRDRRVGSGWVPEGIAFAYTQDHGQTFQRVEQVGGGYDVPAIAGGVTDGMDRSRAWAFANAFPEKSADDVLGAWFPWADYLQKSNNPKGGQIGLFRARRTAVGDPWIVEPNRVIYETWKEQDSGGFHAHTAGMFIDGMVSFWGDVSYRNRMVRHIASDLEDYTMTEWTHEEEFHGGWSPAGAAVDLLGNQALSAAPGPNFGEILVSGDEQAELIMKVERPNSFGDKAVITNLHGVFPGSFSGAGYTGRMAPFLQKLRGVGYVLTEQSTLVPGADALFFSADGEHWSQLLNKGSIKYLFGNRIIGTSSGSLHSLDVPASNSAAGPLLLNPGGQNLVTEDPLQVAAAAAGNTARRVLYVDGVYVYQDTLEPLDVQPETPPPVVQGMPMWEFTSAGTSGNMGAWELGNIASAANQLHWLSAWHYSLDGNGISPTFRVGDQPGSERESVWVANSQWVPTLNFGAPNPNTNSADEQRIRVFNGTDPAPRRWLTAIQGFNQGPAPTYPLPPGVNGANERAWASLSNVTNSWSTALTFGLPELSSFSTHFDGSGTGTVHTLASIYQSNNEHIDVTFTRTSSAQGVFSIDVYSSSVLMDRLSFKNIYFDREDQVRLVLSNSPEELGVTLLVTRNGYGMDSKSIVGGGTSLVPSQIRLSNATQTVVEPMEWYAIQFSPTQTLTTAEREIMIGLSYMFQRLDAPPVIGPPGFDDDADIDGRDFLIWQRGFGITEGAMREDGDANQDGRVDGLDLAAWQAGYGLGVEVGPPDADFNLDGFVDSTDLAAWQEGYGIRRTAGAHAQGDADFDGDVNGRDFLTWQRQYTGPATEDVTNDISAEESVASFAGDNATNDYHTAATEQAAPTAPMSTGEETGDSIISNQPAGEAGNSFAEGFWLPAAPLFDSTFRRETLIESIIQEFVILNDVRLRPAPIGHRQTSFLMEWAKFVPSVSDESDTSEAGEWLVEADLAIADWQTL